MKNPKATIPVNKSTRILQRLGGIFFLGLFGSFTLACLNLPEIGPDTAFGRVFLVICLIFDVLGVMLIIFSTKRSKRIKKFEQKTNYIIGSVTYNQQSVARPVTPTNTARPVTPTNMPRPVTPTNTAQSQSAPRAQRTQVICECCGGINKIGKGIASECEYCGSPMNG